MADKPKAETLWLVVGLGNPGPKYAGTRHNVGFMVVDELARRARQDSWRHKFGADMMNVSIATSPVWLAKPMTYMNASGQSVCEITRYYGIGLERLVAVHDDVDLDLGRIKLKQSGGDAGHKGVSSLVGCLGSSDFFRVRLGIGKNPGYGTADHVLLSFLRSEQPVLKETTGRAADAVEKIVREGIVAAMNQYNVKDQKD